MFNLSVLLSRLRRDRTARPVRCSFCNRSQRFVDRLVAGPHAVICDECIRVCADVVARPLEEVNTVTEPIRAIPTQSAFDPNTPALRYCGFCTALVEASSCLVVPDRGLLCSACHQAISAVLGAPSSSSSPAAATATTGGVPPLAPQS